MNDVRVDLAERDELPALIITVIIADACGFESAQKRGAIALDCGAGIVFGEAEIQLSLAVGAGESSGARRKAVEQPRKFPQVLRAKDAEFGSLAGWFGSPSWHTSMLPEAAEARVTEGFGFAGARIQHSARQPWFTPRRQVGSVYTKPARAGWTGKSTRPTRSFSFRAA